MWSFAYFEVNEFVPVSMVTVRAFHIVPGVTRNPSDASSQSHNPSDLLERKMTLSTKQS